MPFAVWHSEDPNRQIDARRIPTHNAVFVTVSCWAHIDTVGALDQIIYQSHRTVLIAASEYPCLEMSIERLLNTGIDLDYSYARQFCIIEAILGKAKRRADVMPRHARVRRVEQITTRRAVPRKRAVAC